MDKKEQKKVKKNQIDDDILSIVKGFIDYFEHVNNTDIKEGDKDNDHSF